MSRSMKEHLNSVHERLAEHHKSLADHFETLSKCMAKASHDQAKDSMAVLDALAAEHQDMSGFHTDCAEKCAKSAHDEMNKLVPSNISGLAPEKGSARPIPRYGAPPTQQVNIDPQLSQILGVDSEHQDAEEPSLLGR